MTVETYLLPRSVAEAVQALVAEDGAPLVMAGGTVVMPLLNEGVTAPAKVLGLRHAGMDTIRQADGRLRIGAATTLTTLAEASSIPMLREAARATGAWAVRNLATVGGNLFVPPPAGDVAVALLALDAELELVSQTGTRLVPLADFYRGFLETVLRPGELVTEIQVPFPEGRTAYHKLGRRQANTPAVVTVAAYLTLADGRVRRARLALSAVGPHPLRARRAEAALEGAPLVATTIDAAAAAAEADCDPFSDAIASAWYRRRMVGVVVRRALAQIAAEEEG